MTIRIAVLASGRGSNLLAILQAIAAGRLDAEVIGNLSLRARLLDGVEADGPLSLLAGLRRRDARVRLMPGALR